MHSTPNIHILGIQGSGKGTQAAKLVSAFSLAYLASGNLFRERAQIHDKLGTEIASEIMRGMLLPDNLLTSTVDDFLYSHNIHTGLLCDGVIRTITQQSLLAPIWDKHGLDQPYLIHLILSDEEALHRIEGRRKEAEQGINTDHHRVFSGKLLQRNDDNTLAIQERFRLFHSMTKPVIEHFQSLGRCINIDASQPVEAVYSEIFAHINKQYPNVTH